MSAAPASVFAKVRRRVLPLLMVCYLVAFIDRVNVGFAALGMKQDLGFSPLVYSWGAGIFFFGYFLFEVPSNLILERVGARRWIARIFANIPPFWTLPTQITVGTAAAGGIALVNSLGNLSGFAAPYLIGFLKDRTGSFGIAFAVLAIFPLGGMLLALQLRRLRTAAPT